MPKGSKPCQGVARGNIKWRDDRQEQYYVCKADCKKLDRHAEERVNAECMDGLVKWITECDVIHALCEGCKEAADENT